MDLFYFIIAAWLLNVLCNIINACSNCFIKIKNIIVKLRTMKKERAYRIKTSPDIEKDENDNNEKTIEKTLEIE